MPAYDHYICEVNELNEALERINEDGDRIVSAVHTSDSAQMVIIVEKKPDFNSLKEKLGIKDHQDKRA
jgi:hypothetical protein